jgi:cell division FtsZ-interacting protein ZapD
MNEDFEPIRSAIDQILNVEASIKRRKHTKKQHTKDLFINVINSLEQVNNRSDILYADLKVDYSTYDESFLQIIDKLMLLYLGEKAYTVVSFYLWERLNPDGSQNMINDLNGVPVPLDNANDLWAVLVKINPNLEK